MRNFSKRKEKKKSRNTVEVNAERRRGGGGGGGLSIAKPATSEGSRASGKNEMIFFSKAGLRLLTCPINNQNPRRN